jgi:hypothetical protein
LSSQEDEEEYDSFVKNLEKQIEQEMESQGFPKPPKLNVPELKTEEAKTVSPEKAVSPGYTVSYCIECMDKHIAACQKLIEEAITFSRNNECEKALGWVRSAIKELAGMEVDVPPDSPKDLLVINDKGRSIRTTVNSFKLEYTCDQDKLNEVLKMVKDLREDFYRTSSNYV